MKMREIIERVSKIYRDERGKTSDLYDELRSVNKRIYEAEKEGWKTITFAEYRELNRHRDSLNAQITAREAYCEGISCVREMLMDLEFDTEVK